MLWGTNPDSSGKCRLTFAFSQAKCFTHLLMHLWTSPQRQQVMYCNLTMFSFTVWPAKLAVLPWNESIIPCQPCRAIQMQNLWSSNQSLTMTSLMMSPVKPLLIHPDLKLTSTSHPRITSCPGSFHVEKLTMQSCCEHGDSCDIFKGICS